MEETPRDPKTAVDSACNQAHITQRAITLRPDNEALTTTSINTPPAGEILEQRPADEETPLETLDEKGETGLGNDGGDGEPKVMMPYGAVFLRLRWILPAAVMFGSMTGLVAPHVPTLQDEAFGEDAYLAVGLLGALQGICGCIGGPIIGRMADHHGRPAALIAAVAVSFVVALPMIFKPIPVLFFVVNSVLGCYSAFHGVVGAFSSDAVRGRHVDQSAAMSAPLPFFFLGIVIGGPFATIIGSPNVFRIANVIAVVLMIYCWRCVKHARGRCDTCCGCGDPPELAAAAESPALAHTLAIDDHGHDSLRAGHGREHRERAVNEMASVVVAINEDDDTVTLHQRHHHNARENPSSTPDAESGFRSPDLSENVENSASAIAADAAGGSTDASGRPIASGEEAPEKTAPEGISATIAALKHCWRMQPNLRVLVPMAFLNNVAEMPLFTLLGLYMERRIPDATTAEQATLLAVLGLNAVFCYTVTVPLVTPRFGAVFMLRVALAVNFLCMLCIAAASTFREMLVACTLVGISFAMFPCSAAVAAEEAESVGNGRHVAVTIAAIAGARIAAEGFAPAVLGVLLRWCEGTSKPGAPFLLCAVFVAAAFLLSLRLKAPRL